MSGCSKPPPKHCGIWSLTFTKSCEKCRDFKGSVTANGRRFHRSQLGLEIKKIFRDRLLTSSSALAPTIWRRAFPEKGFQICCH